MTVRKRLELDSQLPSSRAQIKKHFQRYIEKDDEIWFSYNGCALKWHFPVGLLYDILVTDDTLPMPVTVHFKKFPDDLLIRFPSKLVLDFCFLFPYCLLHIACFLFSCVALSSAHTP